MQTKTISHDDIARLRGLLDCYQIAPGGEVADGLLAEAAKILKAYQAAEPAAADILAGATINDITERKHQPAGDGWIEWKGGERPVSPDTFVNVEYRDGEKYHGWAHEFRWAHAMPGGPYDASADIIGYRPHAPEAGQA